MDFRTDTVESGGVRTDFAVFGHGPAHLVIIPGMSLHSVIDSAGSVASAFSCLADDYTVWLLERRRDVPEGLSVAEMASDAAAAMESLGIGRADIYGASQGGMIALELALRHPGLVRRLVLASTITRQCARSIEVMGRWEALSLAGDPEKLNRDVFSRVYSPGFYNRFERAFRVLEKDGTPEEMKRFAVLARATATFDIHDELAASVRAGRQYEAMVCGASDDTVLGSGGISDLSGLFGCKPLVYEGTGHAVYDEDPDFPKKMMSFLLA